jgi:hypothetical protein
MPSKLLNAWSLANAVLKFLTLARAAALANRSAVARSLHLESSSNATEAQLNCNKEFD